ncbi:uncharacterized protein LOC142477476, partial [Ascaphus truei]|uniref:uncharacterized protein LOC142477476 n=1 Tax=Ascaphus truei TaxID=8439 RepID=UPI003F598B36
MMKTSKERLIRRQQYADSAEIDMTEFKEDTIDLKTNFFKLERLAKEEMKHWLDLLSLQNYLDAKIVPRGLRFTKKTTFDTNIDFKNKWNDAMESCSFTLIKLLINYREDKLNEIAKEIEETQQIMIPYVESEEFQELDKLVDSRVLKYEKEISDRKSSKYVRDQTDYATDKIRDWRRHDRRDRSKHYTPNKYYKKTNHKDDKQRDKSRDNSNTHSTSSDKGQNTHRSEKTIANTQFSCPTENRFEVLQEKGASCEETVVIDKSSGAIPKTQIRDSNKNHPENTVPTIKSHTASFLELVTQEENRERGKSYPLWDRKPTYHTNTPQRRKRSCEEPGEGSANKERSASDAASEKMPVDRDVRRESLTSSATHQERWIAYRRSERRIQSWIAGTDLS